MRTITTEQFLDFTYDWMCANLSGIESSWPQKGGWEGSAQVQIANDLMSALPLLRVERERPVYIEPRNTVDLVVNDPADGAENLLLVEMKCQSLHNAADFVGGLAHDVYRLDHELAEPYRPAHRLVIGFYFTDHFALPAGWTERPHPGNRIGLCHLLLS